MAVMFIITPLLFWLPLPGLAGFIGGWAGGVLVRRPIAAAVIALLPAVLFALLGFTAGLAVVEVFPFDSVLKPLFMAWAIASSVALVLGAYLGGKRAQSAYALFVNLSDLAEAAQGFRARERSRAEPPPAPEGFGRWIFDDMQDAASDIFSEWRHVDSDDEPDAPPQR
jgi:hypothetical protein